MTDSMHKVSYVEVDLRKKKYITGNLLQKFPEQLIMYMIVNLNDTVVIHYDDRENYMQEYKLLDYIKKHKTELYNKFKVIL